MQTTAPAPLAAALTEELTREAAVTRTLLERVPEAHLAWRPHARSMSLGELGLHLAGLAGGIADFITPLAAEVPTVPLPEAGSVREMLETLEASTARASGAITRWGEEGLAAEVRMVADGETLVTMPRRDWIRALMLNHAYHHRGQLTVYLRLLDVPLPPIYGPTADEA